LSKIFLFRFIIVLSGILFSAAIQYDAPVLGADSGSAWLRDYYTRLQASDLPETRLVVVDIDETSIRELGTWPWPRSKLADLVEITLSHYGAKGVALDMVFPEPGEPQGDLRLAALAEHAPVVLGQVLDYENKTPPLHVGVMAGGHTEPAQRTLTVSGFIGNHAGYQAARWTGNLGYLPDQDGLLRHLPMVTYYQGRIYPTLSLALINCCMPPALSSRDFLRDQGLERVGFIKNFASYTVIPAYQILNLEVAPHLLEGKLVIVGSTALGNTDRVPTPLSTSTSGMMIHAEELSALLDQQAGLQPSHWRGEVLALCFTLALSIGVMYTLPRFTAWSNLLLLIGAAAIWLVLGYEISLHDPRFLISGPLLNIFFLIVTAIPFDWRVSQLRSQKLLNTLRQYVSEPVVNELKESDFTDPLIPKRQPITVLIADMEGYSRQVEFLPIEEAAHLTKRYLDCLTGPVLDFGGTLDRHTGDGLVAFWGAPLASPDHANQALDAAEQILKNIRLASDELVQRGQDPLRVRIGIESGLAITGDFGSSARSIYTAVGECVNIASRLENLAREVPHDVMIGQETARLADRHDLQPLGEFVLRGMTTPEQVFTFKQGALPE
jgi:adenylate cyclase